MYVTMGNNGNVCMSEHVKRMIESLVACLKLAVEKNKKDEE